MWKNETQSPNASPFMCRLFTALVLFALPAVAVPDFDADIRPIFHERCYACHGEALAQAGLRLDDREAARKGGASGAVIAAGDAAASLLIQRVTAEQTFRRMPPAGPPLSADEIATLRAWIDAGADWPEATARPTAAQRLSHWSFQPVALPELPTVAGAAWVENAIDRFVLARLEAAGVAPSDQADRATLLRRVSFDLTGLPPTPEEVDAFVADTQPGAYDRVVDRLLASPHYGERQAIGWLDAARYADSDGYERDPLRPHAWRWRQWVIEALNADMPFDQFTIEQIAGDLLPNATLEQRVATGFLRNGIQNREAGVMAGEKRFEEVLDRISTVGTVWLGLTVGCAQCHDHKFDPLSQKEFYSLYAFLDNAVERDIEAPLPGERGTLLRAYPRYRAERAEIIEEHDVMPLFAEWRREMLRAMDKPGVDTAWDFRVTEFRAANNRSDWLMRTADGGLTDIERDVRMDWFLRSPGPVFTKDEAITARLKKAREAVGKLRDEVFPVRTQAYTVVERKAPVATNVALRGDWRARGQEAPPGVPSVLPAPEPGEKPERLRFAEWLVDGRNPLTARVTVNRVWAQLFGAGLVKTVDDFGLQGEEPSYPALLDFLATRFVESGWSRKALMRMIVTSAAYRQSSAARPELAERDPENRLLARQNRLRLPAELVRDNALAVSGLLNPRIGGTSVHPPQPAGIAELSYSKKPWPEDFGPDRYRRGLYVFLRRTSPYPMLLAFDASDTLTANVRRERTNTPLQALNLLNDPVFVEAAQALAIRAASEAEDGALERMFRLALGRAPSPAEADRVATFYARMGDALPDAEAAELAPFVPDGHSPAEIAALTNVARGLLNLDEFIVRP